uniref:Nedd4 family interacting protein 2 n=1 Tax=Cairina moschata TaxID=8855 RepID=A0A8C3BYX7_CAIMO
MAAACPLFSECFELRAHQPNRLTHREMPTKDTPRRCPAACRGSAAPCNCWAAFGGGHNPTSPHSPPPPPTQPLPQRPQPRACAGGGGGAVRRAPSRRRGGAAAPRAPPREGAGPRCAGAAAAAAAPLGRGREGEGTGTGAGEDRHGTGREGSGWAGGVGGAASMEHHQPASRYRVLHNEDDPPESSAAEQTSTSTETTQTPQTAAVSEADTSPPPYCSIAVEAAATSETHNEFYPVPPPYSVATSLPTYDEAEKAKAAAMAAAAAEVAQREEEYPPRDDFSDADQLRVGNDGIFMLAFFMAFIFNWIGFCLSFCITNTIAGRYGAICGFGLSLIKWILIVRFSDYFTGYFNGQYWLWWIFLVLGLLLFFRGFVNYLKVRNMSESMAAAHRTRFFFLY